MPLMRFRRHALLIPLLLAIAPGCEDSAPKATTPKAVSAVSNTAFVIDSRAKLRATPDNDGKVVATLPINAELSVVAQAGDWLEGAVVSPKPLSGKRGHLPASATSPTKLTVELAAANADKAREPAEVRLWRERAYTLSPSKTTLRPLMATLRQMNQPQAADHFANLFRARGLQSRMPAFARSRMKELTLMFSVGNTPGSAWTVASGTCKPRLEHCQVVQFGRTQLSPITMRCDEPAAMSPDALLEKAPAVQALEREVGALADGGGLGLEPMDITSTTVLDLNEDKRPDRLLVVAWKPSSGSEKGADLMPYSCLVAEVNGAYQVLEGVLCGEPSRMFPAQAFSMQGVAGTFIRVEQELPGARGAFLAHFGKGVLAEVRGGCSG
jgi:hypothetical protein